MVSLAEHICEKCCGMEGLAHMYMLVPKIQSCIVGCCSFFRVLVYDKTDHSSTNPVGQSLICVDLL